MGFLKRVAKIAPCRGPEVARLPIVENLLHVNHRSPRERIITAGAAKLRRKAG